MTHLDEKSISPKTIGKHHIPGHLASITIGKHKVVIHKGMIDGKGGLKKDKKTGELKAKQVWLSVFENDALVSPWGLIWNEKNNVFIGELSLLEESDWVNIHKILMENIPSMGYTKLEVYRCSLSQWRKKEEDNGAYTAKKLLRADKTIVRFDVK